MRIDILTLFPEMLRSPLEHSILKRAQEAGLLEVGLVNIRDFATDRHRTADDMPYGGGAGMVMKPEPLFRAVEQVIAAAPGAGPDRIILMTPLTPFRVVTAKWGAVLVQTLTLLLSGAPALAICAYLGGVGPEDLLRSLAVCLVASGFGAALALHASSGAPSAPGEPSWCPREARWA